MLDENGVSKKAGFVRFSTIPQAQCAIELTNGLSVPGNHTPLVARFAHLKSSNPNAAQVAATLVTEVIGGIGVGHQQHQDQQHHQQSRARHQLNNNNTNNNNNNNNNNTNNNQNGSQSILPPQHFGNNFQTQSDFGNGFHPMNGPIQVHDDGFPQHMIPNGHSGQLSEHHPHQHHQYHQQHHQYHQQQHHHNQHHQFIGGVPYGQQTNNNGATISVPNPNPNSHAPQFMFNDSNQHFMLHGGMGLAPFPTAVDCSDIPNSSPLTKTHSHISNSDDTATAATTIQGQTTSPSPNHSHTTFSSSNGNGSGQQSHSQSTVLGLNQATSKSQSDHQSGPPTLQKDFSNLTLEDFMIMQQQLQQQQDMINSLLGNNSTAQNSNTA